MIGSSRPPAGSRRARRRPISLPLARRLSLIAGLLLLIVGCLVLLAGLGMETLSAVRAYVGGESLWSKAQKEAVHHLTRYALSHAEGDYQAYLSALAVPLGDRQARLELEKPQPDPQVVSEGFRTGGYHPEDVEGMANLFRRFRRVPHLARAIDIWAEGDAEIARLRHLGEALHDAIQSGPAAPERVGEILREVDALDQRLTRLEAEFSGTLGEAARWVKRVILGAIVLAAALLVVVGVAVCWRVLRQVAELLQGLRKHQAHLEALLDLSRELSQIQPVESLLGRIAEACGKLLDTDSAGFRVLEGDDLVVTGTWGDAAEAMSTPRIKVGQSLSGTVAATGDALIVPDIASDPRLLPAHREADRRLGHRAWMGIPVKVGERVLGVLAARTRRPQGFSAEDLAMATAFASQAATALENARLYAQAQQAYEELSRTQAQLIQAQKMEAVGRLAGGVAHDFNNLLTIITGRSRLLLERLDPDGPLRRHVQLIDQTAERAAALTQQLLAFSRKQVLQPKVLDLNAVVTSTEKMLRRLIGEDIELLTRRGSDLGSVEADPGQLEQMILNLAVNARDAMPRGGRLTIETANVELDPAFVRRHPGAQPGAHVALVVSDIGMGMDADTQAHLFEPFFTTKGPGQGTGLGLATVYGIVKQSGGYISVESELGRGTSFTIYLPRIEQAAEAVEPGSDAAGTPQGSETILLVEDEDGVRDLTREILEMSGYTVLEARHGAEALVVGEQHPGPIHLLVSDVVMPQMGGRELADRLRALRQGIKVLFMSGYMDDAIGHHGALDPGTNLLPKPFSPDALARKVREVLDAPADASPR